MSEAQDDDSSPTLDEADLAAEAAHALDHGGPTTCFGSVDEWFRRYWRGTYRRRVSARGSGNGRWAPDWWNYSEALQRLTTLWLAWEAVRAQPGLEMSAWWVEHADPHMHALLATDGCFAAASGENSAGEMLPYTRPPVGLFGPDHLPDL